MNSSELKQIKEILDNGGVIAFPTETVMGLGVVFDHFEAYQKLNQIKRRREDKPYTLMVANKGDIYDFAEVNNVAQKIIDAFVPGPITLLLKAKDNVPGYVTHHTGVIGVRCPAFKEIKEMIDCVEKPLLVPSANRADQRPATTYKEVKEIFKEELDYIVEKDALGDKPSTIVDLTEEKVKIVREGSITKEEIEREINRMKIAIGCDHGGLDYKIKIKEHLLSKGYEIVDVGTFSHDSCHYPLFGAGVGRKVASKECDFGVVICTTGEGIAISANKIKGVRCGVAYDDEVARLMRQHNDANVISFGQKFMNLDDVIRRLDIFLETKFEGGRHQTRVDLISELEK